MPKRQSPTGSELFNRRQQRHRLEGAPLPPRLVSAVKSRRHLRIPVHREHSFRFKVNYGVLTTGFDAPSVRALVIARPVYSRGLYQQMIGRDLRGPKNGGKEHCLIINVADNVAQYGGQLAFRGFEHLWRPWAGGRGTTA